MTRKDYILIADAMSDARPYPEGTPQYETWAKVVVTIATALAAENPRFDPEAFIKACKA